MIKKEFNIKKYPRTPHLKGSRLQPGDEGLVVSFSQLEGKRLVIEEKIDGANCAISFDDTGRLLLQSRGHYLIGGAKEAHYDLFKQWANAHYKTFYEVLGSRYIMYGEWMLAKHKMYYDALPSYFLEFDVFDRERGVFLDTSSRKRLTSKMPVTSVCVLADGEFKSIKDILNNLGKSNYVSENHLLKLEQYCIDNGLNVQEIMSSTDKTDVMEGLYIKVEENGQVVNRLKYVRSNFNQIDSFSTDEWLKKTIIPNGLSVPFESLFDE